MADYRACVNMDRAYRTGATAGKARKRKIVFY